MRIVEQAAVLNTTSPSKRIFEKIHNAIGNLAPERCQEFDERFPSFTLEYLESPRYIIHVNGQKRIQISTFALEFLWVTAYAHFVYYTRIFQGKDYSKGKEIDLTADPKVAEAMSLLRWGCINRIREEAAVPPPYIPWPENLPRPKMIRGDTSDEGVADELTLGSAAVLIFHELAHIALNHKAPTDIEDEKEADLFAWDWVIGDRRDYDSKDLTKRLILLVHAFTSSIIADIHAGHLTLDDHPRSIDRLCHLLQKFEVPSNHRAYAFAFTSLHLHAANSQLQLPPQHKAYESFYESFDQVIDHISQFPTLFGDTDTD